MYNMQEESSFQIHLLLDRPEHYLEHKRHTTIP